MRLGMTTRRATLQGLAALASAPAWAAKRFEGRRMTYISWGGAYQDGQKKAYCDPFSEMTGVQIDQDGPNDNAKFRLAVSSGKAPWDVADVGATLMHSGIKANLFEKLDWSQIHKERIDPRYITDYGVGNIVYSYNVVCNGATIPAGKRPSSWADLWDVKAFPGKRMFYANPAPSIEAALLADGVAPDKLYPLDVDRAMRKLDQIRDQILWWETNSQSQQLLSSGAAALGLINNGRAYDLALKGVDAVLSWAQPIQSIDYLAIPKGAKNIDVATAFIDYVTNPEPQAAFANLMVFSPTNPKAFDLIKPELAPWLATNPAYVARSVLIDNEYWRDQLEPVTKKWNQWRLT